jgi:hypothetical protein
LKIEKLQEINFGAKRRGEGGGLRVKKCQVKADPVVFMNNNKLPA